MADLMQQLADVLGAQIAKKYRVPPETAAAAVIEHWAVRPDLVALIQSSDTMKAVTRTRLYKDAQRDVTRKVYYQLRRYQADQSIESMLARLREASDLTRDECRLELANNHVSTAERMAHLNEFWQMLSQHWEQPKSVLDVGCGILPLVYPFDAYPLMHYTALDRSSDSVDTILAFKDRYNREELQTQVWEISQGWDMLQDLEPAAPKIYDIAFLFKLVPVVARQEPDSLQILAQVPAKKLLVTGCKTAMVKRQDISRRERGTLLAFAQEYGLQVLDEFETPDEVGLVLATSYFFKDV